MTRVLCLLTIVTGLALLGCSSNIDVPTGPVQISELDSRAINDADRVPEDVPPVVTPRLGQPAGQQYVPGPADPTYYNPAIGGGSPELATLTDGPYRMRLWPVQQSQYSHGAVVHMPRWFEDPYDNLMERWPDDFGCSCRDLVAAVYTPGRFLVNLVALPVTMVCHPLCQPAVTDRTAVFVVDEFGVHVAPGNPPVVARPAAR